MYGQIFTLTLVLVAVTGKFYLIETEDDSTGDHNKHRDYEDKDYGASSSRDCKEDGVLFSEGENMPMEDKCNTCICMTGKKECTKVKCTKDLEKVGLDKTFKVDPKKVRRF